MREALKRLVWPLAALLALIVLNALITNGFFTLSVRDDGRLYGIPIDVLFNGSRVMLLALAMSLVIATGGVDLSVGAIMALAGATAAVLVYKHPPFTLPLI
jgi:ribose/xylose/arabinose/galactoside ABC-type transport system permease subunit